METYQIYPAFPNLACLWLHKNDEVTNVVKFNKNYALLGRLLRLHRLNVGAFKTVVCRAWTNQPPQKIIDLGNMTFLFIFANEDDKLIVQNGGPWWFMESHLVLKDCPSEVFINKMDFSTSKFWVQAHHIPLEKRTLQRASKIGRVFNKVHAVAFGESGSNSWDWYLRLLVDMDITSPLIKGMILKCKGMEPLWVQFKYERMPYFCPRCGILGHDQNQCEIRSFGSLNNYGIELCALPRFVPTLYPSWDTIQTWLGFQGPSPDAPKSYTANGSERTFTKTYVMELSDEEHQDVERPALMHLPSDVVSAYCCPTLKGSYLTFDSELHKIGDYQSPPLPPLPVRPSYPADPSEEEAEYMDWLAFSAEEYREYKADLDWVHEDADDDDEARAVRKLILDFEHLSKRGIDKLNDADKAWCEAASEYTRVLLQKWAYPVETGVWEITLVGQFHRPDLMAALFN